MKAGEENVRSARRSNRGLIAKFNIKSVTIPFIAYTVVLVSVSTLGQVSFLLIFCQTRYALTTETQLSVHAGAKGHTYADLYDHIVNTLRHFDAVSLKRLIGIWNA